MLSQTYQFLNERDDGVADAVMIASAFIAAREGPDGGRGPAVRSIAREAKLSHAWLRSLLQPSRTPKAVSVGRWRRLCDAYLDYLRGRLSELETEIVRVEKIARAGNGAAQDLADKARNLTARIEALL